MRDHPGLLSLPPENQLTIYFAETATAVFTMSSNRFDVITHAGTRQKITMLANTMPSDRLLSFGKMSETDAVSDVEGRGFFTKPANCSRQSAIESGRKFPLTVVECLTLERCLQTLEEHLKASAERFSMTVTKNSINEFNFEMQSTKSMIKWSVQLSL